MDGGITLGRLQQTQQYQSLSTDEQRQVDQEFQKISSDDGTITVQDLDRLDLADGAADKRFTGARGATANLLRAVMATPDGQRSGFSLVNTSGRAVQAPDDAANRVSPEYIAGATEHSSVRSDDGDRVTVRSEITDVTVKPDGTPRDNPAQGRLTLGTFMGSVTSNRANLMAGFEPGDKINLGDGNILTVPEDPASVDSQLLARKLEGKMREVIRGDHGIDPNRVFTSGAATEAHDGSFGQLEFARGPDGAFVLIEGGRGDGGPGMDMTDVEPRKLGYHAGIFTTAATDWTNGTSHGAATEQPENYYFGSVREPDPNDPSRTLRADVKGFRPQSVGGPAEDLEVLVQLENDDAAGGRLNDRVTVRGTQAVEFLERVGVLSRDDDGNYQLSKPSVNENTATRQSPGEMRAHRMLPYASVRSRATEAIGNALVGRGDTEPLARALMEAHVGSSGNYHHDGEHSAEEFRGMVDGWIAGWQAEASDLGVHSGAEVFARMEKSIERDVKTHRFDHDYSQLMDILGTGSIMAGITELMAERH